MLYVHNVAVSSNAVGASGYGLSGGSCSGRESWLHEAAKRVLVEERQLLLPKLVVYDSKRDTLAPQWREEHRLISAEKCVTFDKVELEVSMCGLRVDAIMSTNRRQLVVEIRVTHTVNADKLAKLRNLGLSVLEVDLSRYMHLNRTRDKAYVRDILLSKSFNKMWLYNRVLVRYNHALSECHTLRHAVQRGMASHIDDCPQERRRYRGQSYANIVHDCWACQYLLDFWQTGDTQSHILCLGGTEVASLRDLKRRMI